ncbi:hypothetical protein JXA59_00610 [Patescibacteria group bacterium]|nr:hypothetical protein [Patescibacteria group bacterium]
MSAGEDISCPQCHKDISIHPEWGVRYCVDCGINVSEYRRVQANRIQREREQQLRQQPRVRQTVAVQSNQADNGGVPLEIRRWSWPAFIFGWLWCFFNNLPIWGIASLLGWLLTWGFAGFIIDIVLGAKGNEYAWKAKPYTSINEFWRSQRGWQIAVWIFVALVVFGTYVIISWIHFSNAVNSYP